MSTTAGPDLPTPAVLTPQSFRLFAEFITRELGIKMPENKIPMLQSRLQRRLRVLGLPTIEEYKRYLFESPQADTEFSDFVDAVTTNKTDFFREPHHFDFLSSVSLPALDSAPDRPWAFKLWCAGCSSGEEPYTLAMVLSEYAISRPGFDFSIFATDISTRVLHVAREAVYDEERVIPLRDELRQKYLLRSRRPERRLVRIVPALRNRVQFQRLNFMDPDYGVRDTFDVIFFRNVMIYFSHSTQEAVINKLAQRLRPGGYLFIGHSESLMSLDTPFRMIGPAVYQKHPEP